MKRLLFWLIILGVVSAAGGAGYYRFYRSRSSEGMYRTVRVRRGEVKHVVNSTGTVQPVRSVQVGAVVSGPISSVLVDFNDRVKKDQILAELDPQLFRAQRDQAQAALNCSIANLQQMEAKCVQAAADLSRAEKLLSVQGISDPMNLRPIKAISEADYDSAKAAYATAKANVALTRATIQQGEAALKLAEANLKYTEIKSPVDGMIIDRKVDPGQSLASQFQTPVMFVVAPDLEKKVNILASVDEADIGLIRDAQKRNQPVTFTVDAYLKDVFEGQIAQVRLNPSTVQNVVTYTVVVESSNPELKLLPGMTANLSFQIEKHTGVLSIPNAALRFHPKPEQVQPSDRAIVEGTDREGQADQGNDPGAKDGTPGAADRDRKRRHVWIANGGLLEAVEIITGLSDKSCTELVSGDLEEGQELIAGVKTPGTSSSSGPPPPH